jgi:Na+/H+ antiporter NhaD/arsenite permease-like protein
MKRSVPIFAGVVVMFFLSSFTGVSIPLTALIGASLILVFGKVKPSRVIKEVDWVLILFFAGLFIVVRGAENAGLLAHATDWIKLTNDATGLAGIHVSSLLLSQIVSNVPFTILMLPLMKSGAGEALWLALASASTLAGNATIIGAMANLIVIESAETHGIKIRFFEFFKLGLIVTLATMVLSALIIYAEMNAGIIL